jgi:predicted Zn-dependent protease
LHTGHRSDLLSLEQYTRQQIAGLGLGLGSRLSTRVAQFGQVLQQGLGLMFLKYGRDDETQADELGVEYALRAGFDAEAGAKFFEVLDRQTKESGQSLPAWLSTHPAPEGRVRRTHDLAVARKPQYPQSTRIAANDHKARVDGIVFGDDPRQGFQDGDVFKHPGLRFQVTLPTGWQVQNTPNAVLAGAPDQSAVLQMTLEKSGGGGPAQVAATLAQSAKAVVVQSAVERVNGFDGYVAVLRVTDEAGNAQDVQAGFLQREPGGAIYQFIGMAKPAAFAAVRPTFLHSIRSLQTLTDRAALDIAPNRVKVETVRTPATLQQMADKAAGSPVSIATVALVNNLQAGSTLPVGFRVKLVRGTYKPKATAP